MRTLCRSPDWSSGKTPKRLHGSGGLWGGRIEGGRIEGGRIEGGRIEGGRIEGVNGSRFRGVFSARSKEARGWVNGES